MLPGMADHEHRVSSGARELTLEDLARMQPGMARLMPEVGDRVWKCWYAGQAHNRPLARFQLNEAVKLLKLSAFVRPKYEDGMASFLDEDVAPVKAAIEAGDWDAFEPAFRAMVDAANRYHERYNKGFLRWKIPDMPPPDLDMTP